VIVAVEGPSAAGKTTWCRSTGREFVPEYLPNGHEPDGSIREALAGYWVDVNAGRWSAALTLEATQGVAVCDSDPLKLHYAWCLARIGADSPGRFLDEYACVREAFSSRRLGFADVVMITLPDEQTLRQRKTSDVTRTRRSFELHVQLRKPLIEWYHRLDELRPGSVLWQLPAQSADLNAFAVEAQLRDRYDLELLDLLVGSLPAI
jgi:hypothetical protein